MGSLETALIASIAVQRGAPWVATAGLIYSAEVFADAIAGVESMGDQIKDGGALVVLALVLYLIVLKLIPGFLDAIAKQSADHSAALRSLTESINKQTIALITEMRTGKRTRTERADDRIDSADEFKDQN
jgi:hypothetical protein